MDVHNNIGWADRLGSTARYALIAGTSVLGVFMLGMIGGFSYAVIEDGVLPTRPLAYVALALIIGTTALVAWVLAKLVRSVRHQAMSGYDRRYWKMWVVVFGLSVPLGIVLAVLGLSDQGDGFSLVLSNDPIGPLAAILASLALVLMLAIAAIYYHRAVDDHEERAYLWGSTIGYYFLVLMFPLHWLLARGGLIPSLTIGIALLIILFSCVVQALVWALFKFR